jgi:hypothetical protein
MYEAKIPTKGNYNITPFKVKFLKTSFKAKLA